jgi:hypothetical protein
LWRAPGKAAYLALENDPDLEFEHYLAEKLSMTVAEVREMDNAEFVRWTRFYARRAQAKQLASRMAAK